MKQRQRFFHRPNFTRKEDMQTVGKRVEFGARFHSKLR